MMSLLYRDSESLLLPSAIKFDGPPVPNTDRIIDGITGFTPFGRTRCPTCPNDNEWVWLSGPNMPMHEYRLELDCNRDQIDIERGDSIHLLVDTDCPTGIKMLYNVQWDYDISNDCDSYCY